MSTFTFLVLLAFGAALASAAEYSVLKNVGNPGKCLHIHADNSGTNGAEMDLQACNSGSATQLMDVTKLSSYTTAAGYLQFKAGRCITGPYPVNPANGLRLITWDCVGQGHQYWKVIGGTPGAGPFQLQGSNGKCLTPENGGEYVDQWDCVSQANAPHQWFTLDQVEYALLKNFGNPAQCLHIKGESAANGAELELTPCNSGAAGQQWAVKTWGDRVTTAGYIETRSARCVTGPYPINPANGLHLIMWDCVGQGQQNWKIIGGAPFGGPFQLQGSNGKCLTPENGGVYVDQWDCVDRGNAPHQWFTLEGVGGGTSAAPAPAPVAPPPPFKCLVDQQSCNIDDNWCCDGYYCQGFGTATTCRACLAEGSTCGSSIMAQQCCQTSSCRETGVMLGSRHEYKCLAGACAKIGESCDKPCCAGLECGSYNGARVCRPHAPSCAKYNDSGPCPSSGMSCCGRRCQASTSQSWETQSGVLFSKCECSNPGYACVDDSYCCNGGKCGLDYRCK